LRRLRRRIAKSKKISRINGDFCTINCGANWKLYRWLTDRRRVSLDKGRQVGILVAGEVRVVAVYV
jgi:hypothetical protein